MWVKILRDGMYGEFAPDRMRAVARSRGDKVDYPAWYAEALVLDGLAEVVVVDVAVEVVKPRAKKTRSRAGSKASRPSVIPTESSILTGIERD